MYTEIAKKFDLIGHFLFDLLIWHKDMGLTLFWNLI